MKRVLLLAFYFPPRNHVASYRSACFAKYLPENGWLPTVICEDWPAARPDYDPDFVPGIPGEVVIRRIPQTESRNVLYKFALRKLLPWWSPHLAPYLWRQNVHRTVQELCRSTNFHALWATSDPLVTLGLAVQLSAELNLPWLADLRDSFNVQRRGSWYRRPVWAYHERRLCRQAHSIVTVSPHLAQGLVQSVGREVEVIENGFDPELFAKVAPMPAERNVFTLAYTGNLTLPRQNPKPLLQAVELLLERGVVPRGGVEVLFYGPSAGQINSAFPDATARLPVRISPLVPHKQIVPIQQSSSVLLLLTVAGQKGILTGKLFDYLAAKRPILAVPDDQGDVTALLGRTGAGVSANNPEELFALLSNWYREWRKTGQISLPRDEAAVEHYSRRAQAKRLASLLDGMLQTAGG